MQWICFFYLVVFFRFFPTSSSFSGLFLHFDYVFVCVCMGALHMSSTSGGQKMLEVHLEARITADFHIQSTIFFASLTLVQLSFPLAGVTFKTAWGGMGSSHSGS